MQRPEPEVGAEVLQILRSGQPHADGNKRKRKLQTSARSEILEDDAKIPAGPAGLASFRNTDVGNGRRLVHLYGRRVRFFHPWQKWLVWDSKRWRFDVTAEVERLAKSTIRTLFKVAVRFDDSRERDRLLNFARESEKAARLAAMMKMAASEERIPVRIEELDGDPWLLNVINGTLDLRSGKLRPHDERDLITKLAPVTFDPTATCPTWNAFLVAISCGDKELVSFMQRAVGYALCGVLTDKRSLIILHGRQNTGKTTFIEILRDLLGDYAGQIRVQALMEQKHSNSTAPSPDIADLRGCRLVSASEPAQGQRLALALVKHLTGRGRIKARHLHSENVEFAPSWKFFMDTNDPPEIAGTDTAIWARIGLVRFAMKSLEEGEQDQALPEKLRGELSGILNWSLEGCFAWQREGMQMPNTIAMATADYRRANDEIGRFIEEECMLSEHLSISANNLFRKYAEWCKNSGLEPESVKNFGLYEWSTQKVSKRHGRKGVVYDGIALALRDGDGT
jgi:putative DNA primase/helicase